VRAWPGRLSLAVVFVVLAGGALSARTAAAVSVPSETAPISGERDLFSDAPPPSSYDLLNQSPGSALRRPSEGPSMLMQLVRTIVALCGVLFLLWACARVIGPRLARVVHRPNGRGMRVRDRLNLDGRTTLLHVELDGGTSYLIASNDHAVTVVDRIAPSEAAPAPKPFDHHLATTPAPKE
jgi:hypothetical protein